MSRVLKVIVVLALTAGLGWFATPAYAAVTTTSSCSAGGFTGYIRTSTSTASAGTVYSVEYRIDKGSNSGGNKANVVWYDYATTPTKTASTGSGVQDNGWHTLLSTNYYRGTGGAAFKFVFDKSLSDPTCNKSFPLG